MKVFTDEEIIAGCIQQDSRYQRLFFEKYYSKMYAICFRYSKDEDEAKDILQTGFIKAFDGLKKFNNKSSLQTWLTRIMINTAINHLKLRNKQFAFPITEDEFLVPEEQANDLDSLNDLSPEEALSLVQSLPDGYRAIVNMYAIEGMSHKQISENLGISEGTSKSQLSKARLFLKKLVKNINTYVF